MAGKKPLRVHVQKNIRRYFKDMGSTKPENLYQKLLDQIEPPLIEETLRYTDGNQSHAAKILGITRNTLRTRIRRHGIKVH